MGECGRKDSSGSVGLGGPRENRPQHGWGADGCLRARRADRGRRVRAGPARRPRGLAHGPPGARPVPAGAGNRLVALGASPDGIGAWTRDLRFVAPRQTLVLAAAALATVLTTCVALAHGDSERDQRHERLLSLAENDMRHATVAAVDRLTDVASTVQGPLSVQRSQF